VGHTTMQKLVCYKSPQLHRYRQRNRIKRKPFHQHSLCPQNLHEKHREIDDEQPFDHRCNLRKGHPHLWSIVKLRPKVCLCVISIVKAHILLVVRYAYCVYRIFYFCAFMSIRYFGCCGFIFSNITIKSTPNTTIAMPIFCEIVNPSNSKGLSSRINSIKNRVMP